MTNLISTKFLEQWYREEAIREINEVFTDEMGLNPDEYDQVAEFERVRDIVSWWIEREPSLKNIPERFIRCLDDHAIMREIKKEFVIIVLERDGLKHFYYVFRKKNND